MMKRDINIMRMVVELVLKLVRMMMMIMLQIFKPVMKKKMLGRRRVCYFASQAGITHFGVIDP
jgi:hypothetical protein